MLASVFIAAVVMATSALAGSTANATSCGTSSYLAHFTSIAVSPSVPVKGAPVALTSSGTISAAVSGGVSSLVVKLDGVQLFTHAGTTCGETTINFPLNFGTAVMEGLSCPVVTGGSIAPGMKLTLPAAAPSGQYEIVIDAKDTNSNEVYCLQAQMTL